MKFNQNYHKMLQNKFLHIEYKHNYNDKVGCKTVGQNEAEIENSITHNVL